MKPVVTGIGSMPAMSTSAAAQWIVENWGDLPHVAELPSRGPWAGMIGRSGALLPGMALDLTAHGFRVVASPGSDQRRIESLMRSDFDALEDALAGQRTPIKIQVAGPWTLAQALEGRTGRRLLQDSGACRDLAHALAEGIAAQVGHALRIGATSVIVQVDEPSIVAVRRGSGATLFSQPRIPEDEEISNGWRALRDGLGSEVELVIHSCADALPWHLFAPFDAISLDGTIPHQEEGLGAWMEAGRMIWWGALAVDSRPLPDLSTSVGRVRNAFARLGFPVVSDRISLTPACGLAGVSPEVAGRIARHLRDLSEALREAEA